MPSSEADIAMGFVPTGMVFVMLFNIKLITLIELRFGLVTYSLLPSGLMAMAYGPEFAEKVVVIVFVVVLISETLFPN